MRLDTGCSITAYRTVPRGRPSGGPAAGQLVADACTPIPAAGSSVAHSPQNFSPGWLAAPHAGQATARGAAHSEQDFRPSRFSVPQLPQIIPPSSGSEG
jgi:hypothetical protein